MAFSLAQGLARTREEAAGRRPEFAAWLEDELEEVGADDFIDPQKFLDWQRALPRDRRRGVRSREIDAELTGTNGRMELYSVMPMESDNFVNWIDASGYSLARSGQRPPWIRDSAFRDDFDLRIEDGRAMMNRKFAAR